MRKVSLRQVPTRDLEAELARRYALQPRRSVRQRIRMGHDSGMVIVPQSHLKRRVIDFSLGA